MCGAGQQAEQPGDQRTVEGDMAGMAPQETGSPPAACRADEAVMTATMMSMTSMGMFPGSSPKTKTRMNTPTIPYMPRPMDPTRAPMKIIARTMASCRSTSAVVIVEINYVKKV